MTDQCRGCALDCVVCGAFHDDQRGGARRFLLFAGADYYPSGGWDDYVSAHATEDEAVRAAASLSDWWHVVDLTTGERVADDWDTRDRT